MLQTAGCFQYESNLSAIKPGDKVVYNITQSSYGVSSVQKRYTLEKVYFTSKSHPFIKCKMELSAL